MAALGRRLALSIAAAGVLPEGRCRRLTLSIAPAASAASATTTATGKEGSIAAATVQRHHR